MKAMTRALTTSAALATAFAIGYLTPPAGASAAPAADCQVHTPHVATVTPAPLARGHLVPM